VEPSKPTERPSKRFKDAMRKILSVPKKELVRREHEYKKQRNAGKAK
jgi:hypothetical protein